MPAIARIMEPKTSSEEEGLHAPGYEDGLFKETPGGVRKPNIREGDGFPMWEVSPEERGRIKGHPRGIWGRKGAQVYVFLPRFWKRIYQGSVWHDFNSWRWVSHTN